MHAEGMDSAAATGGGFPATLRPGTGMLRAASTPSVRSRGDRALGALDQAELGAHAGDEVATAAELELQFKDPPVIRHPICFNKPRRGSNSQVTRPLLDCNCHYHDMVRETIYMAGSHNTAKIGKYLDSRAEREAAQAEWSSHRFRKQRETAALWQEMRQTFDQISGRPQGERPVTSEAETPPPPAGSTPSRASARFSAFGRSVGPGSTGRASVAGEIFEELSVMGLTTSATPSGSRLSGSRLGRGHTASQPNLATLRGSGSMQMGQSSVVQQSPGTRGLPKGFKPAVAMHTGVMMFPKDRAFHFRDC